MSQLPVPNRPVSVIMAAYNGHRYIVEQLSSILHQLHSRDEVIVVDDASGDDTAELVAALRDPRIRLIRLDQNVGYVAAFEMAMVHSTGDYLLLSDQDDVWLPNRVRLMVAALETHDVVAGNLITLDGPPTIGGPYGQSSWRLDPNDSSRPWWNTIGVIAGNRPYFGSAMGLRRDALAIVLPFPAYLKESHDLWIALCGIHLNSIAHLGVAVTARRYHDSNESPTQPRALPLVLRSRLLVLRLTREALARSRFHRRSRP